MRVRLTRWLTAQETAAHLDTTSAEICHLLSIGRLSGTRQKDPRRVGTAQWLVDPKSISKEKNAAAPCAPAWPGVASAPPNSNDSTRISQAVSVGPAFRGRLLSLPWQNCKATLSMRS
jgi:hypothetical protein